MTVKEIVKYCTTFDPKAIDSFKFYVDHNLDVNNTLTDLVDEAHRGSWSIRSTYVIQRHNPAIDVLADFEVSAIGIEDEHTLGIIVER